MKLKATAEEERTWGDHLAGLQYEAAKRDDPVLTYLLSMVEEQLKYNHKVTE